MSIKNSFSSVGKTKQKIHQAMDGKRVKSLNEKLKEYVPKEG